VEATDAATSSSERARAVLHAALDAVVAIDADSRILEWNPAAERTFGHPAAEALGRDLAELIVPPALRARHRAGLARALADGVPGRPGRRFVTTGLRADGTELPVELAVTRAALPGRAVFVGCLRDVTAQRRADAELRASRARIAAAADDARRRIERDLHDGAQQRLVGLALTLRLAQRRAAGDPVLEELLDEAAEDLAEATDELRELARGIHPVVLTEGGLEPALAGLAGRLALPVRLLVDAGRLPERVEATAYFVIAEALTNVVRHAGASCAEVEVRERAGRLLAEVRDDGRGGATPSAGSGLRGLADRVAAADGTLALDSPPGAGTTLRLELPCGS
jgi:PAS domain S-box-containing protein